MLYKCEAWSYCDYSKIISDGWYLKFESGLWVREASVVNLSYSMLKDIIFRPSADYPNKYTFPDFMGGKG